MYNHNVESLPPHFIHYLRISLENSLAHPKLGNSDEYYGWPVSLRGVVSWLAGKVTSLTFISIVSVWKILATLGRGVKTLPVTSSKLKNIKTIMRFSQVELWKYRVPIYEVKIHQALKIIYVIVYGINFSLSEDVNRWKCE